MIKVKQIVTRTAWPLWEIESQHFLFTRLHSPFPSDVLNSKGEYFLFAKMLKNQLDKHLLWTKKVDSEHV